jgi:hypothetical protein
LSTGYQSELYNGTCISIETAPYQADPCIADVALLGECEAIISGDSDFAMYVGPGGPDKLGDLMLRNVMYDYKNRTIVSCKLITGQRAVKNLIHNILTSRMTAVVFEEDPQHPLFDGIEDPKLRVLFAIALGCDALPHVSGQKNFGAAGLRKLLSTLFGHPFTMPEETEVTKMKVSQLKAMLRLHGLSTDGHKADLLSRLQDYINKPDYKPLPPAPVTNHNTAMKLNDPNVYVELAERIASFRNTTPDAIMSMLNSVYYEPTGRGYMYCEPTKVDEYIKEFAAVVTKVVPGPAVAECKGCCNGVPHKFLVAEGVNSCTTCKAVLCQFCVWEEDAVAVMCFECKRFSLVGEDMPTEEDYPSESVMRQLLKNKYSANVPATASYHQVVELYKMKSTREPLFPEIANIKYPLQPTSCLDPLHPYLTLLMLLAGKTDSALDTRLSILHCLNSFAVGTDLAKKPPGEPNPSNLGLLREKCRYIRPEMKAERLLQQEGHSKDVIDGTTDYVNDPIVLVTSDEYAATQNAVDELKMFLRQNKQPKPRSKSHTPVTPPVTPIGFQVLRYRAHVDRVEEFTDRLDSVSACHDKWNMAFEGAKVRSLRHLQLRNNTDNAETQSENGADGVEDDEDGGISVTMEGSDGVDQPTAVLPTVTTSRRDEQLCNLRRVMKKWLRRRNTGQSKREFAKDNGLTWGVLNKYIASDPNKRR